jgi:hypothetical protein
MGDAGAWPEVPSRPGTSVYAIAPDERWLVGPAGVCDQIMAWAREQTQAIGPTVYAVDVTDAWSVWSVAGARVDEVWTRLSENPVPTGRPAFVQGAVAMVPAKAIVQERAIHFFVPAPVGHCLPQRILEACADLAPQILPATDLAIDPAAVAPRGFVSGVLSGVRV